MKRKAKRTSAELIPLVENRIREVKEQIAENNRKATFHGRAFPTSHLRITLRTLERDLEKLKRNV